MRTFGVALLQHTELEMGSAKLPNVRRLAIVAVALLFAACGSDDDGKPPQGPDPLLDGGRSAFDAFIQKQRGKPVVVNKWASWCGPCRVEFPLLRHVAKQDKGVVFIGVNSNDNDGNARRFLAEEPVPYKHFKDPKLEIASEFHGVQAFPTTAFYDSKGELAFVHVGPYRSESDLAADIDRYARGSGS
jgi:cytochrome c biogenesis protein CcmG/thiol:disulfide interchange protein DsbE